MTGRPCAWCRASIDATARRDAMFCSKRCRQASHRFTRDATRRAAHDVSRPMRLAYADPPYPGLSGRYYADHPDFAGEVDHLALLEQLSAPAEYDLTARSFSIALTNALARMERRRKGPTRAELPPRRPVSAMTALSLSLLLADALARMDHLGYPKIPAPTAHNPLALEA